MSKLSQGKVQSFHEGSHRQVVVSPRAKRFMTAQRILLAAWFGVGIVPFLLQARSFLKFATPHKITETLVVPPGAARETVNLPEVCPVKGLQIGDVWWNAEATHYFSVQYGNLCHFVVPQYNVHGKFLLGKTKAVPFRTAPASCSESSYPVSLYFYHGSIGYYAFYEEVEGTHCIKDKTAYGVVGGLGTFDINGSWLAEDPGSDGYRTSYWYASVGMSWLIYRALVLRRGYISCKRYGSRCDQLGEDLRRRTAMVFVHESLRLSAHGATNFHRALLLYFLAEGLMSDLFLLVATDGIFAWIQYISLGYNLSGVLLLMFEMLESMRWLTERWRLRTKRLLFNYESALLGEILSSAGQHSLLSSLNRSALKDSQSTAIAASYYVWSLVGHGVLVSALIAFILMVRATWAVGYVWLRHGTLAVFSAPCCVDTTLGMRTKMTILGGYRWEGGRLYYKMDGLKSFGLLKMEEDGAEFLVLRKLHWFVVPADDLVVIGSVSEYRVKPCNERPCAGVISFFDRSLGGNLHDVGSRRLLSILVKRSKVSASSFSSAAP